MDSDDSSCDEVLNSLMDAASSVEDDEIDAITTSGTPTATTANTTVSTHRPGPPPEAAAPIADNAGLATTTTTATPTMTGRVAKILYLSCDPDHLNDYQCLVRQHLQFFEATPLEVATPVRGRNKPIVLGQVGLRCIHCHDPNLSTFTTTTTTTTLQQHPPVGSVYYPLTLLGIYQAAQTLANGHWLLNDDDHHHHEYSNNNSCPRMPPFVRQQLRQLKHYSTPPSAGKQYWAETAAVLGVYQHPQWGLRFQRLGPLPETVQNTGHTYDR